MPRRLSQSKPALMVRVLTEIGKGQIHEDWIDGEPHEYVKGLQEGRHIWVNPAVDVVDTVIHECLHRLEPSWSERYIRNRTSFLLKRLSSEQIQQLYEEYERIRTRKKKRKKPHAVQHRAPTGSGDSVSPPGIPVGEDHHR